MDPTEDQERPQTPPPPVHPSQMASSTPRPDQQSALSTQMQDPEEGECMSGEDGEIIEESSVLPLDVTDQETRESILSPSKKKSKVSRKRFNGCSYIGEYTLQKKIGEGTFGEVSFGLDRDKEKFALKRIILHNDKEGMPLTSLREIKILKSLNHHNIIGLHEMSYEKGDMAKKARGQLFMVFPYMDHDLAGLLENPLVKLQPQHIKSYIKQLLEGLDYMHKKNILHRDMKSANILINNKGRLKIADFGLARTLSEQKGAKYTNLVVTRWYRPPELLMGETRYTAAVDVWGAGCIFGEMLKRRPIMAGSNDMDQLERITMLCGTPTEKNWPGYSRLPLFDPANGTISGFTTIHPCRIREKFPETQYVVYIPYLVNSFDVMTVKFLEDLLTLDPRRRPTASEALRHRYFSIEPLAAECNTFEPFPSSHELDARKAREMAANTAKYIPGGGSMMRPVLPNHFDALPAIGNYVPPRDIASSLSFDKYSSYDGYQDKRRKRDRDRSSDRRGYSRDRYNHSRDPSRDRRVDEEDYKREKRRDERSKSRARSRSPARSRSGHRSQSHDGMSQKGEEKREAW